VYDFIFPNRSMNKSSDDSTNTTSMCSFLHLDSAAAIWMTTGGGCMISHAAGGDRHISTKFPPKEFIGEQSRKDTLGTGWME
jgi:hypothetical protein